MIPYKVKNAVSAYYLVLNIKNISFGSEVYCVDS